MNIMRITELQIIKFGKFSDFTIKINDGLNVIYGKNEAGKSTALLFIKSMFYGIAAKRKKNGEISDRMRIIPWNGERAAGRIKLIVDSRRIEIYREFGMRASGDIVRVTDSDTGEDFFDTFVQGEEVGERLLGMSRQMFERTLWIGQDDVCMRGRNDEITARLMNFLDSGSAADVSVDSALSQLEKKELSIKARTKRNTKGEIDLLEEERERLSVRLHQIKTDEILQRKNCEHLKELEAHSKRLEKEFDNLNAFRKSELAKEKIKRVERLDGCLRREMQLGNTRMFQLFKHKASPETVAGIESEHKRISELEVLAYEQKASLNSNEKIFEKRKKAALKNQVPVCVSTAVIIIACVLCFVLNLGAELCFGLLGTVAVLAVVSGVIVFILNRSLKSLSVQIEDMKIKLGKIRSEIFETEQHLSQILEELECENYADFEKKLGIYSEDKAKIKMCRDIYAEALGNDDYAELKKEADELKKFVIHDKSVTNIDYEERLKALETEKERTLSQIIGLKNSINAYNESNLAVDIEVQLNDIDKRIAQKQRELKAVRLAAECLGQAYKKIKSDFTPYLNHETMSLLSEMTSGQHENIRIADDFSVNLNGLGDSGEQKQAEFFSMGTYNQIYFALRLAIMRMTVSPENRVLYIDDMLMTYDDERCCRTIGMLKRICDNENVQILLFTCHSRDIDYTAQYGETLTAEI